MTLLGAFLLAMLSNPSPSQPIKVETKGVTAGILDEAPIVGGHLPELAGKYKLRITEITIAPGGHVGEHNHRSPGIRKMTEGRMNYITPDKSVVYSSSDYFFEAGDVSHRAVSDSGTACKHLLFEILPEEVEGPSLIPAQNRSPH
jgi:quercetin dioxygenase-like cupin family protein